MPAASMKPPGAGPDTPGLTEEDLWHLVDYVQSLPYEKMAAHGGNEPVYARMRQ